MLKLIIFEIKHFDLQQHPKVHPPSPKNLIKAVKIHKQIFVSRTLVALEYFVYICLVH